jgi:hypothetical protein
LEQISEENISAQQEEIAGGWSTLHNEENNNMKPLESFF